MCKMVSLCLGAVVLVSATAQAQDVLIAGAANPAWTAEVANTLVATGLVDSATPYNLTTGTPTLAELQAYDAVLAFTDSGAQNADLLGDNLADYVDSGGGVLQMVFSWHTAIPISGRWQSGGYAPMTYASQSGGNLSLGTIHQPGHPVLAGVNSFFGGTASYYNTGTVAGGATLIADWTNGAPLIIEQTGFNGGIMGLNFYPPSTVSRADFWDASTDGDLLMGNALAYVVPEPATLGLLGIGAFALLRRRR